MSNPNAIVPNCVDDYIDNSDWQSYSGERLPYFSTANLEQIIRDTQAEIDSRPINEGDTT